MEEKSDLVNYKRLIDNVQGDVHEHLIAQLFLDHWLADRLVISVIPLAGRMVSVVLRSIQPLGLASG